VLVRGMVEDSRKRDRDEQSQSANHGAIDPS
jgi:hypothetical protein